MMVMISAYIGNVLPVTHIFRTWTPALWRQAINGLWQMFRKLSQKFIARKPCAPRQIFYRVPVKSLFELVGRDWAILTGANPRVCKITLS